MIGRMRKVWVQSLESGKLMDKLMNTYRMILLEMGYKTKAKINKHKFNNKHFNINSTLNNLNKVN